MSPKCDGGREDKAAWNVRGYFKSSKGMSWMKDGVDGHSGCWTKIGRCAQENARACHLMVLLCMDSEGLGGVGDEEEEQGEEKHFEEAAW